MSVPTRGYTVALDRNWTHASPYATIVFEYRSRGEMRLLCDVV